ncbi:MAG: hypothetical protein FWG51_02690 [Firmicutes bacterium]|nr:hypothetical protein [Bacillota bacterium]
MGLFSKKEEYSYKKDQKNLERVIAELNNIADEIRLKEEFEDKFRKLAKELKNTPALKDDEAKNAMELIETGLRNYKKIQMSQDYELNSILKKNVQKIIDAVNQRIELGR